MTVIGNRVLVSSLIGLSLTLGITGCEDKTTVTTTTDSTAAMVGDESLKNAALARQFIDEVFNKGNMTFFEEHTSPDIVEHMQGPNMGAGMEGMKQGIMGYRAAFPDLRVDVVNTIADGDMVTIQTRQTGTNTGSMMGMPATGKKMDVMGVDLVRIKDGKTVEHWGYFEEMKMMQQLGMMPPPGTPPPAGGAMDSQSGSTDTSSGAMGSKSGSMDTKGGADTAGNMGKK